MSFKNTVILQATDGNATESQIFSISKNVDATFTRPISPSLFEDKIVELLNIQMAGSDDLPEEETSNFGLDILIAEDNEVNQIVFTEVLNDLGANFKIAGNGQEAVELWKTHNPAIVLMDVSMPVMSGHEATKAIRAIEEENDLRHTPICAITAHALKGDKEDCFAAGMDDYLSKPVSPDMMAAKIGSLLPKSHPLNKTFAVGEAA
ncbi:MULTISPECIES: response regulator [unclassified Lentilitoribacter]|uniref:response regulator n=1 Tax=unclassified Lentilitoribacter TaxID=2647570 RepID=UPI001FCE6ACF|nr:response regulator [Lentilitoribacter sp. Alg239-R112]